MARAYRRHLLLALMAIGSATLAPAQVVKCVDADGNVTYQDSPCTSGQSGRSVELPKAETREDTSAWEAAARDAKVVRGMPKRWVLRSRGAPAEIRPGNVREDATEVWRYTVKDGNLLVGFAGGDVAWVREDAASRAAPPPATPPATPPAAATRGPHNRRFVIAGRYCEHVFAEIGAADREEPLTGAPAPGVRYTYEPQPGDPSMRTVFTCVDGKVADVERTMVK